MFGQNELPQPPGVSPLPASPPCDPPPKAAPNIRAIVRRTFSHLLLMLLVMGVGVAITMVVARRQKPAFKSETTVEYKEGIKGVFLGVDGGEDLRKLPLRFKETLTSRAHLERIIKEFNLYPNEVAREGYVAAVDAFRKKITFKPKSSEAFLIAFEGSAPEEAQQVTARLAGILIEDVQTQKRARAEEAARFLEEQKKRADAELLEREVELARFIALHPEFAAENDADLAGSGVRAEKAKAIADPELGALNRQQDRIVATLAAKAAPRSKPASTSTGPSPALLAAKRAADAEVATATRELAGKEEKLTSQHPDVRQARSRLEVALAKQREATAELVAATPPEPSGSGDDTYETKAVDPTKRLAQELTKNQRAIQMRKQGIKSKAGSSTSANEIIALETEWKNLNRAREAAKSSLTDINARLGKARSNAESELGGYNAQIGVLDPAYLPTMSSSLPKSKLIAIGVALSVLFGIGAALSWAMFLDDRIFAADEIAPFAEVLVVVPPAQIGKKKGGKSRA